MSFAVDTSTLARRGRGLLESLITAAIIDANLGHLNGQETFDLSNADEPVPDEVRRPVSVNAIAQSLRIPFETVRRRIGALAAEGVCRISPKGVIIPAEVLSTPERILGAILMAQRLREFYLQLANIGFFDDADIPERPELVGPEPVRALARLTAAYFLRSADALTEHLGGLNRGVVLLGIVMANVEHFSIRPDTLPELGRLGPADDDLRPARLGPLARRIGLPEATVRRHASALASEGACDHVRGGFVVRREVLHGREFGQLAIANRRNVNRLFSGVARTGVLSRWSRSAE